MHISVLELLQTSKLLGPLSRYITSAISNTANRMFRQSRRNFSLRDSPHKVGTSSTSPSLNHVASPLRPRYSLVSESPAKRMKLSDEPLQPLTSRFPEINDSVSTKPQTESHPLSSTLLQQKASDDWLKPVSINGDLNGINLIDADKSFIQKDIVAELNAPADTPPPTPEARVVSKVETLAKQRSALRADSVQLDSEVEDKLKEFSTYAKEFASLKDRRSKYEDYAFMVKRLGDKIRNQLNSIFNPGNEFAQKFEDTSREMQANHRRRFETKSLEWNNTLDQLRSAIVKKGEELKHEIELHRRTCEHNKHLEDMVQAAKEMNEMESATHKEDERVEMGSVESAPSLRKDPVNMDDDIQGCNTIDCITLEESEDPVVEREDIVTEQSAVNSEVKEDDEEATDVEDNQEEEGASFTPCQAQRID